jgi:4-hydroxybenzoate polyprenyltransferase
LTPHGEGAPAPADAVRGNIVDTLAPLPWRPYLRLARIDRPIGWWLLLLPCWWSAALAAIAGGQPWPDPLHCLLFLVGAIAMRGAGSTWNDIVDRKLDAQVERTRQRPLPSGQVTTKGAALFAAGLSLVGLAVLLSFNAFSIVLGFLSLLPVAVYPFMKRITNWPQAVLGLAFAWGALMGWAAVFGSLSAAPVVLYAGTILWVVGYDTVYAMQDIEDDAIVGIGSTARRFGDRSWQLIGTCYAGTVLLIGAAFLIAGTGIMAWITLLLFAAHLGLQTARAKGADAVAALRIFRSNRDAGLLLFAGLALDALLA